MATPPPYLTLRRDLVGRREVPIRRVLIVLFSYLPWRFQVLRPVLEGEPVILIEDGGKISSIKKN